MIDQQKQVIDYREIGASGLRRFSGFIFEEFLTNLTGWKGNAIYKEMSQNDPTVSAVLFAIDMLCRRVPWRVEEASSTMADKDAAEFLETCMNDMSSTWIDTISEILSMLTYGYSYHEIVYKRRCGAGPDPEFRSKYVDGRIGWRKIPIRSQDSLYRWQFDDHGGIRGVEQLAPPHYYHTVIPIEKALLFRTTITKNNPEGRSVLRGAYRPWYMKKNIENIEAIGIERDLAGLPVALVPPELLSSGKTAAQAALFAEIQKIVTNIRRDEQEGIVFPSARDEKGGLIYELKLLSTGGQRQFDTDKIIQRYDQRIAMSALADFILLGQDKVGSFALAHNKTNLFMTAIGAFLDIIADVFNRYAVPRLFALNDFRISDYPQIRHGDLDAVNVVELGDYITKLAGAGMPLFPNVDLEKYLMKVAGLPEPIDDLGEIDLQVENQIKSSPDTIEEVHDPAKMAAAQNSISDSTPINTENNGRIAPKTPGTMGPPIGNNQGNVSGGFNNEEQELGEKNRPRNV